jgi:hypothetical protein
MLYCVVLLLLLLVAVAVALTVAVVLENILVLSCHVFPSQYAFSDSNANALEGYGVSINCEAAKSLSKLQGIVNL